jgi:hypothetical protein
MVVILSFGSTDLAGSQVNQPFACAETGAHQRAAMLSNSSFSTDREYSFTAATIPPKLIHRQRDF